MDGFQLPHRHVIASGAVTVASTDCVITLKKTSGAATNVNLPIHPQDGQIVIIKDEKGDANSNNITLLPDTAVGTDTVEGASSYVVSVNKQSLVIQYNATTTNWNILSGS